MEHRSAAHLEVLLSEKITELNQTISHLKKIQTSLKSRCQEMHTLLHMDLSQISLIQRPSRYLVFVPTSSNLTLEEEITNVVKETKRRQLHRLHDAAYGSATPVEYLMEEKFLDYTALFIEIPSPAHKKGLHYPASRNISPCVLQGKLGSSPRLLSADSGLRIPPSSDFIWIRIRKRHQ